MAERGARLGAALVVLGAATACNINKLLNTKDKDTAQPGQINSKDGLPFARAGAVGQFQVAFSGSAAGAGSSTEGHVNMTALLADEYLDLETFPTRIAIDDRAITPSNGTLRTFYLDLSQARVSTERAAGLYQKFDPTNVLHAEMLNLAGYSYILFAENYCSGVPFDSVTANGSVVYAQPLTTDSMYHRALADFAAAGTIAAADSVASGGGDPKSIEQLNLARVGQARVLLDQGQFANAAAVASMVPAGFVYNIEHSTNTPRENNGIWYFLSQLAFGVANNKDSMGLNFVTAADPRVRSHDTGAPGFSGNPPNLIAEDKYTTPADPVVLANDIEARLILAEAQLKASDAGWIATLDSLRTHASPAMAVLTADSTTLASPSMRVDVLFRERAFWMFLTAHRLSDMRRLVRQYGRTVTSVYATGTTVTSSQYGTDTVFPVSSDETNNPNFHGCLNTNP